jgi:hypothetical protein
MILAFERASPQATAPPRPHAHPIQALDQPRQLRRGQPHDAVLDARPTELAALQPLGEQAQARAVPEDQFPIGLGPEFDADQ